MRWRCFVQAQIVVESFFDSRIPDCKEKRALSHINPITRRGRYSPGALSQPVDGSVDVRAPRTGIVIDNNVAVRSSLKFALQLEGSTCASIPGRTRASPA